MAHLAGKCCRQLFLDLFGEGYSTENSHCYDVCDTEITMHDCNAELCTLINAVDTVGEKGELKVVQWIRGSSLAWTDQYDKNAISCGKSHHHSEKWWRTFIRQCHVLGLVQKQLWSVIKKSEHYSIQGILVVQDKGREVAADRKSVLLPKPAGNVCCIESSPTLNTSNTNIQEKSKGKTRLGKGTHGLSIVRHFLAEKNRWTTPKDIKDCHFLGTSGEQSAFYIEDCQALYSICPADTHYLWADIQFSKEKVNNYETTVNVGGEELKVIYRSAPCNGVKICPVEGCSYTVPVKDHRSCRDHPNVSLQRTNTEDTKCPMQFGYVYPVDFHNDRRRWLFGFVHHHKGDSNNLHNHPVHSASYPLKKTLEDITNAAARNSALKPTEIAQGKGVGYVPGVVDQACTNLERVSHIVKKAREPSMDFDVLKFESVADQADECDIKESCTLSQAQVKSLKNISRPYLASAGIEDGIQYIHTMNPLMSKILARAEFVETDITFNETKEYPYVFNMVAFNQITIEWMVVSRVRMTREDHNAYALGFRKTFE